VKLPIGFERLKTISSVWDVTCYFHACRDLFHYQIWMLYHETNISLKCLNCSAGVRYQLYVSNVFVCFSVQLILKRFSDILIFVVFCNTNCKCDKRHSVSRTFAVVLRVSITHYERRFPARVMWHLLFIRPLLLTQLLSWPSLPFISVVCHQTEINTSDFSTSLVSLIPVANIRITSY
jgi:hypothetical protein